MSFDTIQKFDLNSLKKKHKYKYDLAIGIPVYSITKNKNHDEIINRLKEYICEIKKLFPNIRTQIIFSNNSKENIDELKNIEDVEVINNNCNLYAFYARKKAFEASNAFYFWTIDDDVCIYNTNVDIENIIIKHLGDENYVIGSKQSCSIFLVIVPTNIMKKVYDKIGNNSKIKIYGEDVLPCTAIRSLIVNNSEQIKFDNSIDFRSFYQDYSSTFDKNNKNILNFDEFIYFITERKRIYNDWFELNYDYMYYTTHLETPKETKEKIINYFIKNNLVQKIVKLNTFIYY